jgi:hypothetical protein
MRAIATPHPFLSTGIPNKQEEIMRVTTLVLALLAAGALPALGQEGTAQDIKQGAKKAGEKVKEGVETVGEKTKEAAKTVGEKTKETAETVGKKTKETARTVQRKSEKTLKKTKAQTSEKRSTNQEPSTPAPTDR